MSFNILIKFVLISTFFSLNLFSMKRNSENDIENLKLEIYKDPDALFNRGKEYFNGERVEKDYKEALKWFLLAAEQNQAEAQNHIGYMLINGIGVDTNYNEAFKWFLLSAKQNDPYAQYEVGDFYLNGYGFEKDYNEAIKWFLKAYNHIPNEKIKLRIFLYIKTINYIFKCRENQHFEN